MLSRRGGAGFGPKNAYHRRHSHCADTPNGHAPPHGLRRIPLGNTEAPMRPPPLLSLLALTLSAVGGGRVSSASTRAATVARSARACTWYVASPPAGRVTGSNAIRGPSVLCISGCAFRKASSGGRVTAGRTFAAGPDPTLRTVTAYVTSPFT